MKIISWERRYKYLGRFCFTKLERDTWRYSLRISTSIWNFTYKKYHIQWDLPQTKKQKRVDRLYFLKSCNGWEIVETKNWKLEIIRKEYLLYRYGKLKTRHTIECICA